MDTEMKNGCLPKRDEYPLTVKAESYVESLAPHVSESLAKDIEGFLRSLRSELQDDEALALVLMKDALRLIPKDLKLVKNAMLGFFLRIEEQILYDNV